jgi:hypothetical protein
MSGTDLIRKSLTARHMVSTKKKSPARIGG